MDVYDPIKKYNCSSNTITRYQKRISGPLLDRIDIHVEVPHVDYEKLADKRNAENSTIIRTRVQAGALAQLARFKGTRLTAMPKWVPPRSKNLSKVATAL
jgi:magnesium chelatase family protein